MRAHPPIPALALLASLALPFAAHAAADAPAPFAIASAAFPDGGYVPRAHACDGAGTSPPLAVTNAPAGTAAVALVVGDGDVPFRVVALSNYTHWVVYDAPVDAAGSVAFPEGGVPAGAVEGKNQQGRIGWTPPCPPQGSPPHRYVFTAFALDAPLGLPEGATRAEVEAALEGRVLAEARLTGCYWRFGVGMSGPALPVC